MKQVTAAIALLGALCASAGAIAQQSVADFYKGRTVSIVMGTGPGGSYDLYGRLVANHYGKHIPGNPTMIVEHMPGAGGATAANFMFGPGPQDGSKILLTHALPLIEKLQSGGVRFESRRFQWLGAYDQISQVLAIWHTSPGKNIEELKTRDIVLGSMGRAHLSYQWAALLKDALGAQFRVISGYPTGGELSLAMERGEIAGWTIAWENVVGNSWLRDKKSTCRCSSRSHA